MLFIWKLQFSHVMTFHTIFQCVMSRSVCLTPSRWGRFGLPVLLWRLQVNEWHLFLPVSRGLLCRFTGEFLHKVFLYSQLTFHSYWSYSCSLARQLCKSWSGCCVINHLLFQGSESDTDEPVCKACHPSCLDCKGPSMWDCTVCHTLHILSDDGRCLSCCGNQMRHDDKPISRECCDCTASQGKQDPTLEHGLPAKHTQITALRLLPGTVFMCVWVISHILWGHVSFVMVALYNSTNW